MQSKEDLKKQINEMLGIEEVMQAVICSSVDLEKLAAEGRQRLEERAAEAIDLINQVIALPDADYELMVVTHSLVLCYSLMMREKSEKVTQKVRSLPVDEANEGQRHAVNEMLGKRKMD